MGCRGEGAAGLVQQVGVQAIFAAGAREAAGDVDHAADVDRHAASLAHGIAIDLAEDARPHQHQIAGAQLPFDPLQRAFEDHGIVGVLAVGVEPVAPLPGQSQVQHLAAAQGLGQGGGDQAAHPQERSFGVGAALEQVIVQVPAACQQGRCQPLQTLAAEAQRQAGGHPPAFSRSLQALVEVGNADRIGGPYRCHEALDQAQVPQFVELAAALADARIQPGAVGGGAAEVGSAAAEEGALTIAEADQAEALARLQGGLDPLHERLQGQGGSGGGIGPGVKGAAQAGAGGDEAGGGPFPFRVVEALQLFQ